METISISKKLVQELVVNGGGRNGIHGEKVVLTYFEEDYEEAPNKNVDDIEYALEQIVEMYTQAFPWLTPKFKAIEDRINAEYKEDHTMPELDEIRKLIDKLEVKLNENTRNS